MEVFRYNSNLFYFMTITRHLIIRLISKESLKLRVQNFSEFFINKICFILVEYIQYAASEVLEPIPLVGLPVKDKKAVGLKLMAVSYATL